MEIAWKPCWDFSDVVIIRGGHITEVAAKWGFTVYTLEKIRLWASLYYIYSLNAYIEFFLMATCKTTSLQRPPQLVYSPVKTLINLSLTIVTTIKNTFLCTSLRIISCWYTFVTEFWKITIIGTAFWSLLKAALNFHSLLMVQ